MLEIKSSKIPYFSSGLLLIVLLLSAIFPRDNLCVLSINFTLLWIGVSAFLLFWLVQKNEIKRSYILGFIAFYFLWMCVIFYIKNIPAVSLYSFMIQSALPLSFFIALPIVKKEQLWQSIAKILVFLFVVLALFVLWQHLILQLPPQAFFENKNLVAALLNMGLWLVAAAYIRNPKTINLHLILIFLFMYTIGIISSRGAVLACAVAFILFCLCVFKSTSLKKLIVFILIIVLAYLLSKISFTAASGFTSLKDVQGTAAVRFLIWTQQWHMIMTAPWLGHGLGSFTWVYPIYRLPMEYGSSGFYAHNDYLQTWSDMGVLGLLIFIAIGLTVLLQFARNFLQEKNVELLGLFCALLTVAIHSLFTFNFYIMPSIIIVGLLLARFNALTINKNVSLQLTINKYLIYCIIGLLFIIPILLAIVISRSYFISEKALVFANRQQSSIALREANKAQKWWPYLQAPVLLKLRIETELLSKMPNSLKPIRELTYKDAIDQFKLLRYLNPYNDSAFLYRGILALENPNGKNLPQAIEFYQTGLYLNRWNFYIRENLIKLLIAQHETQKAKLLLGSGLQYHYELSADVLSYYQFSKSEAKKLNIKEVETLASKLLQDNEKQWQSLQTKAI